MIGLWNSIVGFIYFLHSARSGISMLLGSVLYNLVLTLIVA